MLRVAILGAGISGLTLAYYLKKNFQNKILITVIEKEEEVGRLFIVPRLGIPFGL